jgi:formylmethanofuran dehydrogenase subunit E
MANLQSFLELAAQRHRNHLCPRQVLGVRMGMYAGEWLGIELPQTDKRVFCFVETDGCMTDGIAVATGCWWGSRTMRLMDYGKTAATFIDTQTKNAVRITPTLTARQRANTYVPDAPDKWHAQVGAYQVMPTDELLYAQSIQLTVDLQNIISKHGMRVVCDNCGEDIINERFVERDGQRWCRACAEGAYYVADAFLVELPSRLSATANV